MTNHLGERECSKWKCPGPEAVLRCRDCPAHNWRADGTLVGATG